MGLAVLVVVGMTGDVSTENTSTMYNALLGLGHDVDLKAARLPVSVDVAEKLCS